MSGTGVPTYRAVARTEKRTPVPGTTFPYAAGAMQVSLEPFRAAERRDPTGTGVHLLCTGVGAVPGLGRVPEGITWGALAVITVVRRAHVPPLLPALPPAPSAAPGSALAVGRVRTLLWSGLSPGISQRLEWTSSSHARVILGLLLWPVIHRWPAILCALAAGSAAAAAARVAGVQLISHLSTSGLLANVGMAAALALLVHARTMWGWAGGLALAGLTGVQMLLLTVRTSIVACVAAGGVRWPAQPPSAACCPAGLPRSSWCWLPLVPWRCAAERWWTHSAALPAHGLLSGSR